MRRLLAAFVAGLMGLWSPAFAEPAGNNANTETGQNNPGQLPDGTQLGDLYNQAPPAGLPAGATISGTQILLGGIVIGAIIGGSIYLYNQSKNDDTTPPTSQGSP